MSKSRDETGMLRKRIGAAGEELAADYLSQKGYRILDRNVRTPYGEIDLIAGMDGVTVFVEVKTRTGDSFGLPEESVTRAKLAHLADSIRHYWAERGDEGEWRADVIAIRWDRILKEAQVEHFEDVLHG